MSTNDFNKVYTSGKTILFNPVESNSIFLVAACLSASLEYLFDISGDVDSPYYQDLFEVITEETLVFGVVQLVMVFLSSLTTLQESWATMFQWGQLLMIYMAAWLTIFVLLCAHHNAGERAYWHQFESQRMSSSASILDEKERLFKRCVNKFRVTMMAYDYTSSTVLFADYLAVIEKRYVVKLMDLNWKSWLSMVITAVANSTRAGAMLGWVKETDELLRAIPVITYVILQGFVPLFFFAFIANTLHRRLNQYLTLGSESMEKRLQLIDYNAQQPDVHKHKQVVPFAPSDLQDPKSFLIWQNLETTLTLVQIAILQIVWYYSICAISMYGTLLQLSAGYYVPILIISLVPGIYLWRSLSWTISLISILSSVETALDKELVDELSGISKEDRAKEEEEKAKKEKEKEEEERKKNEETVAELKARKKRRDDKIRRGDRPAPEDEMTAAEEELLSKHMETTAQVEPELDDEGRVKVVKAERAAIEFDDMYQSRVAVDRKEALRVWEEMEGVHL